MFKPLEFAQVGENRSSLTINYYEIEWIKKSLHNNCSEIKMKSGDKFTVSHEYEDLNELLFNISYKESTEM